MSRAAPNPMALLPLIHNIYKEKVIYSFDGCSQFCYMVELISYPSKICTYYKLFIIIIIIKGIEGNKRTEKKNDTRASKIVK